MSEKVRAILVQSFGFGLLSWMEEEGKIPSSVSSLKTNKQKGESKIFCLLGFDNKRPNTVLVASGNKFSLVSLSI